MLLVSKRYGDRDDWDEQTLIKKINQNAVIVFREGNKRKNSKENLNPNHGIPEFIADSSDSNED